SPQDEVVARRDGSISGRVVRIIHSNMETGFHILRVALDDGDGAPGKGRDVSFVGICEPVAVGDRVEGVGQWERSAKYGRQLRTRHIRVLTPTTGEEIYIFLR